MKLYQATTGLLSLISAPTILAKNNKNPLKGLKETNQEKSTCENSSIIWNQFWKHCQRHDRPEGWVLLNKVTSLGHIASSYTKLDQTSSESRPSTNFEISTKHQHFDKTKTSWPNLASESRPRLNFITPTKHQQQYIDQTSASKNLPGHQLQNLDQTLKPCAQSLNKNLTFQICTKLLSSGFLIINMSNSNNLNKFWVVIFRCQGHINQVY